MKRTIKLTSILTALCFALTVQADEPVEKYDHGLLDSAFNGDLEKVELFLEKGASVETTAPKDRTALMLAAANGHTEIVELLHKHGADINARDSDGQSPLMYATHGLHPSIVKYLLENGAEVDAQSRKLGFTALMIAASGGHEEIVRLLLEHDANTGIAERFGKTAADQARQHGHESVAKLIDGASAPASDS